MIIINKQHRKYRSFNPNNTEDALDNINNDNNNLENMTKIFNWPLRIKDSERRRLVEIGPRQCILDSYPYNQQKRLFSKCLFHFNMANGEMVNKSWLVYSTQVYFFGCKLFDE